MAMALKKLTPEEMRKWRTNQPRQSFGQAQGQVKKSLASDTAFSRTSIPLPPGTTIARRPLWAGTWTWIEGQWINDEDFEAVVEIGRLGLKDVSVTETPSAGRMCRELRMGGCAQTGFASWSGMWVHKKHQD